MAVYYKSFDDGTDGKATEIKGLSVTAGFADEIIEYTPVWEGQLKKPEPNPKFDPQLINGKPKFAKGGVIPGKHEDSVQYQYGASDMGVSSPKYADLYTNNWYKFSFSNTVNSPVYEIASGKNTWVKQEPSVIYEEFKETAVKYWDAVEYQNNHVHASYTATFDVESVAPETLKTVFGLTPAPVEDAIEDDDDWTPGENCLF